LGVDLRCINWNNFNWQRTGRSGLSKLYWNKLKLPIIRIFKLSFFFWIIRIFKLSVFFWIIRLELPKLGRIWNLHKQFRQHLPSG